MSYQAHMKGYNDPRTLYQTDSLHAWKHGLYFPPVLVEISPVNTCNQVCRYCYSNAKGKAADRLGDDALVGLFGQLADAGVKAVLLQGTGEPLLHTALPKAAEAGARRGLPIGLNTNGVLLTASVQERLLPHLFYVKFSVLDSDPRRYARYHGCSESQWRQLTDNIAGAVAMRNARGLGVALWATVYLFRDNFREAYDIVRFYKDLGLDYVVIQEATYTDDCPAGKESYASSYFSAGEVAGMKEKVAGLNDADFRVKAQFPLIGGDVNYAGMTRETFRSDFCSGIKFYTTISADGLVYPCWRMWGKGREYSYGSIYENTFEEIWRGRKRGEIDALINTTPPCGAECVVCNHARLNGILWNLKNADSKWKEFII